MFAKRALTLVALAAVATSTALLEELQVDREVRKGRERQEGEGEGEGWWGGDKEEGEQ